MYVCMYEWCLDLCFVTFQSGASRAYLAIPLAVSSVAGTFEVLSFVTVLFVLQIKNQLDWQWRYSFWVERYNFYLVHGKNRRLMFRFVLCDFPRWSVSSDVKCRRYIGGFIPCNSFICASNQNPPGLTIEKIISSWVCNFYLIQAKNRRLKLRFVFCDFPRRSVSSDVKWRRYIQAFVLRNIFISVIGTLIPKSRIPSYLICSVAPPYKNFVTFLEVFILSIWGNINRLHEPMNDQVRKHKSSQKLTRLCQLSSCLRPWVQNGCITVLVVLTQILSTQN